MEIDTDLQRERNKIQFVTYFLYFCGENLVKKCLNMTKNEFINTLYTNDNLFILHGMNSNLVDLIYLDPPFNSKRTYSAPIGSRAVGASFKDMWTWKDVNDAYLETLADKYPSLTKFIVSIGGIHSKAMMAYLTYMAQRIIEMHRILKGCSVNMMLISHLCYFIPELFPFSVRFSKAS